MCCCKDSQDGVKLPVLQLSWALAKVECWSIQCSRMACQQACLVTSKLTSMGTPPQATLPSKYAGRFTLGSACRGMMVVVLVMGVSVRLVFRKEKSRLLFMVCRKDCWVLIVTSSSMTSKAPLP